MNAQSMRILRPLMTALLLALFVWSASSAEAQVGATVDIVLTNGSSVRGQIVADPPGQPLVIQIDGQQFFVPREQIARMVAATPAAVTTYPQATAQPSLTVPGGLRLSLDSRGFLPLDPSMSPALSAVVNERNLAYRRSRSSLVLPVIFLGLGVVGWVATRVAVGRLLDSCAEGDTNACNLSTISARAGYGISAAVTGVGAIVLTLKMLKRRRGQRELTSIDERLRRDFGASIATVAPVPGGAVGTYSLTF